MVSRVNRIHCLLASACVSCFAGGVLAQDATSGDSAEPLRSDLSLEPDGWYTLDSPDAAENDLDEAYQPRRGMFKSPLQGVTDPVLRWRQDLYDQTGLRVGFRYITQTQHASGGPGNRTAAADDIDLMFDWTLVGRGTPDTGRFVFTFEERYRLWYAEIPPSGLRGEIGSLAGTTGAFSDRGPVVRDVFWDQRLLDAKLRLLVGRAAPDDYAGTHRFQSSVMGFFNGNFSGNVTTPWPGHGPLALASLHPTEEFYFTVATCNANSSTTEISVTSLDDFELFTFGEVGYSPMISGVGRALFTLTGWYMPERDDGDRPDDQGVSLTYQQNFGDRFWAMARYGYADEGLARVRSVWQAAFAVNGLLGSPENVTGIGISYAEPAAGAQRDETTIESFHRFQLTRDTQLSVGAQAIVNPSNAPDDDLIGVFSIRLNFTL